MHRLPILLFVAGCAPGTYQEIIDRAVDDGLPGVALYVSGPGDRFDGTAGDRVLNKAAYRRDDLFRIASNSKSFLGVIAAQMADEGRLDLDTPLADHLPAAMVGRIANADRATLRQALTHTSGIADYLESDAFWDEVDNGRTEAWTTEEALVFAYDKRAEFPVGTDWGYSNTNYLLAGLVLDDVLGRHHSQEIRDRIVDPLGLSHTFYEIQEPIEGELVHGYSTYFKRDVLFDTSTLQQGYGLADGGMVASAADLGRYIRAIGTGNELLTDSARDILFGDGVKTGEGDSYGLGISVFPSHYGDLIGHGGSLDGYTSEMYYWPQEDVTIVVFTNTSDGYFDAGYSPDEIFDDVIWEVKQLAL